MNLYKQILFATDLTKESNKVADRALDIAQHTRAKLSIVHIVEFSPLMYGGGEFAIPLDGDVEASLQNQAKKALVEQAQRLAIPKEDQYILTGTPAEELAALVNKLGIDLLIVGSKGRGGFAFLFGSTSNALLHTMPCHILAVHT